MILVNFFISQALYYRNYLVFLQAQKEHSITFNSTFLTRINDKFHINKDNNNSGPNQQIKCSCDNRRENDDSKIF